MFTSALLFPGICCGIALSVNAVAWYYETMHAIPFGTMVRASIHAKNRASMPKTVRTPCRLDMSQQETCGEGSDSVVGLPALQIIVLSIWLLVSVPLNVVGTVIGAQSLPLSAVPALF